MELSVLGDVHVRNSLRKSYIDPIKDEDWREKKKTISTWSTASWWPNKTGTGKIQVQKKVTFKGMEINDEEKRNGNTEQGDNWTKQAILYWRVRATEDIWYCLHRIFTSTAHKQHFGMGVYPVVQKLRACSMQSYKVGLCICTSTPKLE